jgi:hypothetical protein
MRMRAMHFSDRQPVGCRSGQAFFDAVWAGIETVNASNRLTKRGASSIEQNSRVDAGH